MRVAFVLMSIQYLDVAHVCDAFAVSKYVTLVMDCTGPIGNRAL